MEEHEFLEENKGYISVFSLTLQNQAPFLTSLSGKPPKLMATITYAHKYGDKSPKHLFIAEDKYKDEIRDERKPRVTVTNEHNIVDFITGTINMNEDYIIKYFAIHKTPDVNFKADIKEVDIYPEKDTSQGPKMRAVSKKFLTSCSVN